MMVWLKNFAQGTYDFFALTIRSIYALFIPPFDWNETLYQMYSIGVESLPIVLLTSFFTGMIFSLQTGHLLMIFGAKMYVGTGVALAMILELGPALTGLVLAGRVGAGIAAELGSMKVTEQIDALRAMGTDTVKKLVSPRLLAGLLTIPPLTILADLMGILGGAFVAANSLGLPLLFYRRSIITTVRMDDLIMGFIKPFFNAAIIILVGSFAGLSTKGGTEGVGKSTTKAVVIASILILVSDYFITQMLMWVLDI